VVVDEYIAVLLSMSAGGRHGVFGWMQTIVDLEFGDVTPHVPLVEDKVGSVSCVRMSYYRRWAVRVSGGSAAKRGRETENSQGTKVSRSNTDNGSQQRPICFHPMASLNNDGCVVDRCSYYHPQFSDRDSSKGEWLLVARKLMNEGKAVNYLSRPI
jgi:hypothetical protein